MQRQNFCGTCGQRNGTCRHTDERARDSGFDPLTGLLISGAVGFLTGSAILGGLIGGNFLGGVVGDELEDDDGLGFEDFF